MGEAVHGCMAIALATLVTSRMSISARSRVSKQDPQHANAFNPKTEYLFIGTLITSPNHSKWHIKANRSPLEKNKAGVISI